MQRDAKVYVAGHRGLVGSALMRRLEQGEYRNVVTRTHAELDLCNQREVISFFEAERPEFVFVAAAKVGGILANDTFPAEFLYQNLMIETNVIQAAHQCGARKLLFLGSSCIYPKHAPQPMTEDCLLSGKLEPTNEAYAIAKIAGIKLCAAYNRQYKSNFLCVMPTNLFGPNDNYNLATSHVVPALLRKMHVAKKQGISKVSVWGTGTPRRELLYSDDLADACVFLMERHNATELGEFINVGVGEDMTIRELAVMIADVVGYAGGLEFDTMRPDGTQRKLLDVRRMKALGWKPKTSLREGLRRTYDDFLKTGRSSQ